MLHSFFNPKRLFLFFFLKVSISKYKLNKYLTEKLRCSEWLMDRVQVSSLVLQFIFPVPPDAPELVIYQTLKDISILKNFLLTYSWFTVLCSLLLYSKVIQLYMHIYCYPYSFSLWLITGYWILFPVLYSRTLFIHPIYNSLHLLIPNSLSFPPPASTPRQPRPWQP